MLEIKGQVLHRVRLYLKFPGWLSDLNVLLTRKLPLFLLRLNKISGVRGNMCFGIIAENFEAFENDIFYCKVMWMLRVNGILLVPSLCDVCSAVSRSVDFLGTMFACGYSVVRVATFSKSSHSNTVDLLVAVVAK